MAEREIVITGTGLITPLGKTVEENWENLKRLRTGIACYPGDESFQFFRYLGKVENLQIPDSIPPSLQGQMKFLSRASVLGFLAASQALSQSSTDMAKIPPERRALYTASGDFTKVGYEFMYPAMKSSTDENWRELDCEKLNVATMNKVNPFFLLESISNNLFSFLSAAAVFMGPNTSLASLSPCGRQALELACRELRQNRADIALVVGYGSWINQIPLYELHGLGLLSKGRSGINSYRPFDKNRDGFIPGEGGSALLLEPAELAVKRGSTILGKVKGMGDCIEFSSQRGLGVAPKVAKRSIIEALAEGTCEWKDLAFIVLHGSGTQKGDRSELRSVLELVRETGPSIPVCGLKPYTGHMGSASDLAELIFGLYAARESFVPATLNFRETEAEFSELKISHSPQECRKKHFLSVSYGLGGQSSSAVIEVP